MRHESGAYAIMNATLKPSKGEVGMVTQTPVYDEFLEFLIERVSPEVLVAYEASEAANTRVQDLLMRQSEGILTAEERDELRQVEEVERLMMLLKARALSRLHDDEAG